MKKNTVYLETFVKLESNPININKIVESVLYFISRWFYVSFPTTRLFKTFAEIP